MIQMIDDEESEDLEQRPKLQSISLFLDYFIHELSCRNNNFEFVQAVMKLFIKVFDMHIVSGLCELFSKVFDMQIFILTDQVCTYKMYIFLGNRDKVKQYMASLNAS